jgi:hypothetical protein
LFCALLPIGLIFQNKELYFDYKNFKKESMYIDTLLVVGGSPTRGVSSIGINYKKNIRIAHFRANNKSIKEWDFLEKQYYFNKKNLDIWYSSKYNLGYFDDNIVLRKMSYFNLWFRPLIEISIFIFITIIILSWSKYFKKELAKYGLTSKEYNRLRKENKLDDYLKNYENE